MFVCPHRQHLKKSLSTWKSRCRFIRNLKSLPEKAEQQWRLQRENQMCGEELLFSATFEYKVNKIKENVVWESCQLKYSNILALFLERFRSVTSPDKRRRAVIRSTNKQWKQRFWVSSARQEFSKSSVVRNLKHSSRVCKRNQNVY